MEPSESEMISPDNVRAMLNASRRNPQTQGKVIHLPRNTKTNGTILTDRELAIFITDRRKRGDLGQSRPSKLNTSPIEPTVQAMLVDFLKIDLELAFTLLEKAKLKAIYDPECFPAVIKKVKIILMVLRHFEGEVQDHLTWACIRSRIDDLQSAVDEI